MTGDAPRRRRRRAASTPVAAPAPTDGKAATAPRRALPMLPLLAGGLGLALLATAWTTRWPPGPPREAEQATRVTIDIPPNRQGAIGNWERFFACYDLRDDDVIKMTLRANQRAQGNLAFPGEKVIVEFPSPEAAAARPAASSAEEELVALYQRIKDSPPDRRQCGG